MKSVRRKSKRVATRTGFVPLRFISYLLHATGLERFYKPRLVRSSALLALDDDIVRRLPKHSQTILGSAMDPMNLVLVGSDKGVRRIFKRAGWTRANPASPVHVIYNGVTLILGKGYRSEPFMPHFVNMGLQDYAFQKKKHRRVKLRERHHIRVWRTGIVLPGDKLVWVAAASYDTRMRAQLRPPFIHHEIDPNIDAERDYIVKDLQKAGALKLKTIVMNESVLASSPVTHAHGDSYFTDGRAVAMEVIDET